jgi:hypothetical protein
MAEYLGEDDSFEKAITDFSERYADQNQKDYGSSDRSVGVIWGGFGQHAVLA